MTHLKTLLFAVTLSVALGACAAQDTTTDDSLSLTAAEDDLLTGTFASAAGELAFEATPETAWLALDGVEVVRLDGDSMVIAGDDMMSALEGDREAYARIEAFADSADGAAVIALSVTLTAELGPLTAAQVVHDIAATIETMSGGRFKAAWGCSVYTKQGWTCEHLWGNVYRCEDGNGHSVACGFAPEL